MTEFLEEAVKDKLETAWWHGSMHHMDPKKYPKKPALLWDDKADDQSPEAMLEIAFAMASNGKELKQQYLAEKDKKKMN